MGDLLTSVLGGKGQAGGGGLGGLLEQLAAAANAGSNSSATAPASGGGLDALIRSLGDAVTHPGTTNTAGSLTDVQNPSFQKLGEPKIAPTPQQDAAAGLMLRAMLQAAKCDGRIDEGEKKKLLEVLGNASPEDMAFVNRELASPVDIQGLVRPKGAEKQIYAASVMAVDLDSQKEAEYLGGLASGLGLGPAEVNAMHAQFGIPALYAS